MSLTKASFPVTFAPSSIFSPSKHSQTLPDDGMVLKVTSVLSRHGGETKSKTKMCCAERKYMKKKMWPENVPQTSLSSQGLFVFYIYGCFTVMYGPHVSGLIGARRGHWVPWAAVTNGGCWRPNLGPLQEQSVLLTSLP